MASPSRASRVASSHWSKARRLDGWLRRILAARWNPPGPMAIRSDCERGLAIGRAFQTGQRRLARIRRACPNCSIERAKP